MPAKRDYKRKNYFIKKGFQSKFILKFCFILLCGIILSTGLVFIFSQETLTSSFNNSRLVISSTAEAIMPTLLITNLITLGIITLAAIGVTLFVSHRIAGPMFRFEKDIKRVASGDLSVRINLRHKDQFSEMADAFNEMASSFHGKIVQIDKALDQAMEDEKKSAPILRDLKAMIQKEFTF